MALVKSCPGLAGFSPSATKTPGQYLKLKYCPKEQYQGDRGDKQPLEFVHGTAWI